MINFHKALITTAIVFCVGFSLWSGWTYRDTGQFWAAASALGFAIAAVALILYLKNLRRFLGG